MSKLLELRGCLHHGPWSRAKALSNMELTDEPVFGPLRFTPRRKCQSGHGVRGPHKYTFKGLHHPLTWSNGFCGERGKRGAMIEKGRDPWYEKHCYNKISMNFLEGKRNEDKTRQENGLFFYFFIFFPKLPSLGTCWKINTFIFLVYGHSSWSTFSLHLVRGPKALNTIFFKEIGPWRKATFHGPWCQATLIISK
jgi:hypothetical protein